MSNYKLEEKLFLSKAIISNVHSMLLKSRFNSNDNNLELVKESTNLAIEMLKQRNELFGETKKITKKQEVIEVDFEEIINIFNQVCSELPQVLKVTKERQNLVTKILQIHSLENIGEVFIKVSESDYLLGKINGWKANFDWIMNPTNFVKILEDNYKNKIDGKRQQEPLFGRQDRDTFVANATGWDNT